MSRRPATNREIEPDYSPVREGVARDKEGREWEIRSCVDGVVQLTRGAHYKYASRDVLMSMGWTFHFQQQAVE
jgi:hypothetical protein